MFLLLEGVYSFKFTLHPSALGSCPLIPIEILVWSPNRNKLCLASLLTPFLEKGFCGGSPGPGTTSLPLCSQLKHPDLTREEQELPLVELLAEFLILPSPSPYQLLSLLLSSPKNSP